MRCFGAVVVRYAQPLQLNTGIVPAGDWICKLTFTLVKEACSVVWKMNTWSHLHDWLTPQCTRDCCRWHAFAKWDFFARGVSGLHMYLSSCREMIYWMDWRVKTLTARTPQSSTFRKNLPATKMSLRARMRRMRRMKPRLRVQVKEKCLPKEEYEKLSDYMYWSV